MARLTHFGVGTSFGNNDDDCRILELDSNTGTVNGNVLHLSQKTSALHFGQERMLCCHSGWKGEDINSDDNGDNDDDEDDIDDDDGSQ